MSRVVVLLALLLALPATAAARRQAPGAPGAKARWAPADKHGFGTSATRASHVWFTLRAASMTEVYYPDLSHPSATSLQFFVDGKVEGGKASVAQSDPASLTYRQTVATSKWRLTKTYVTDPDRMTVLVRVRFEALDGKAHRVAVRYDPSLYNDGNDDVGWTRGHVMLAHDSRIAGALVARPAFGRTSSGYLGRSDGKLSHPYDALRPGNVVQSAATSLTGRGRHRDLVLALGFGVRGSGALADAKGSLNLGFDRVAAAYAAGWRDYRAGLAPIPAAALPVAQAYETSLLVLKAHEDKTYPGAFVASPTMPWGWGRMTIDTKNPRSGPYHLVWSRDLYEIGTALLAAGDRQGAGDALDFLFDRQQEKDGSFPQNSQVDGRPKWAGIQLDEQAFPIVLAWQLNRFDAKAWGHVRRAADFIVAQGPRTGQDRWENQDGYSPGTIAAEVAGLICAADIARRNGDAARAARYEAKADPWAAGVQRWTATPNGPYAPRPYYLRLTKDRHPERATKYKIGDSGPSDADQRAVVDPSFLELVRLGVKRFDDPAILNTLQVIDARLRVGTRNGDFWHRFTFDGYGEQRDGGPWQLFPDDTRKTLGRVWPIFAGERGEYELLAGRPATTELAAMAAAGNDGGLIPEQVWDGRPPGRTPGEGTLSATPLAWSHAQLVRLAWSIAAGRPVERPAIVAGRYAGGSA